MIRKLPFHLFFLPIYVPAIKKNITGYLMCTVSGFRQGHTLYYIYIYIYMMRQRQITAQHVMSWKYEAKCVKQMLPAATIAGWGGGGGCWLTAGGTIYVCNAMQICANINTGKWSLLCATICHFLRVDLLYYTTFEPFYSMYITLVVGIFRPHPPGFGVSCTISYIYS